MSFRRTLILVPIFIYLSCVSKTVYDQRFQESSLLAVPSTALVTFSDPNNYKFVVVGDLHLATDVTRLNTILNGAQTNGASFVFILGDIADQGDEASFVAFQNAVAASAFNGKVFSAIGNHDVFNDGWTYFKKYVGPSFYTISMANAKFIVMDTADGTLGQDHFNWVKNELSEPRSETNLFFISHYLPTVPPPPNKSWPMTYLKLANEPQAKRLMKMATQFGVNSWFGGHFHSFGQATVESVNYVVAGGGGGRRMGDVTDYFYVVVTVAGNNVSSQYLVVP